MFCLYNPASDVIVPRSIPQNALDPDEDGWPVSFDEVQFFLDGADGRGDAEVRTVRQAPQRF